MLAQFKIMCYKLILQDALDERGAYDKIKKPNFVWQV